jgi:MraZ protein
MTFVGSRRCAIDQKGRIAIPAELRRAADRRKGGEWFVLMPGFEGCLMLLDREAWQRLEERLRENALGSARGRAFQRAFLKDAHQVTVDSQGRITIPPSLMGLAELGREAELRGLIDRIEVWAPDRFDRAIAPFTPEDLAAMAEDALGPRRGD